MAIKIGVLLMSVVALASPAMAETWQRYTNDELGFSISLPMDRFAVTRETAGRVTLEEVGGAAQLDIFGVRNPDALSVGEFQQMMEAADPDRRITYRAAGRSWFVLSGYLDGENEPAIFYAKFMLNAAGTALSAFEISYPRIEKAAYDDTVERLEDSLTRPR
jgi:hypothetical protein